MRVSPLQRVTFAQTEGVDFVDFNLKRTRAYLGNRRRNVASLASVAVDEQGEVSTYFDPPIQPGETVTIGLRPYHNPDTGGVYLFGVTAFPAGEKSYGQFLGFGRLHFYENSLRFFHRW